MTARRPSKKGCKSILKYELTSTVKNGLHQIKALIDIPRFNVKSGDLGGWVENEKNLSQEGDCWISGNAEVSGNAVVYGNAGVHSNARVSGDAEIYGDAHVSGNAYVSGDAEIYGDAHVSGNAHVSGDAHVSDDAWVYGNAYVSGNTHVFGNARVFGNAEVREGICKEVVSTLKKAHDVPDTGTAEKARNTVIELGSSTLAVLNRIANALESASAK